ncbi:hypothetical protein D5086_021594 [Populus alba]|uniref:Uncharacterized protein n=1 Tax=Populus alba TaxID=43335 RepID=A0ACC4BD64_POPAL
MFTTLQPPHGLLQFCRVMVVVITLFSSAAFSSAIPYQLHPDEGKRPDNIFRGCMILKLVTALKQIDKRLTQGGQPFELGGACSQDSEANSTSVCNCTLNLNNDSYCHITSLSLKTLNFQGKLPSEMVNLTYLKYLSLEANQFSGTIPSQLGDLVNLTDLRASDNNLSGRIPDFIGNWSYLDKLELYASGLQGPIPPAILSLEKLRDLRITDMSGPEFNLPNIPPRVKTLVLRNINLTGVIPADVWTMASLTTLKFERAPYDYTLYPNQMLLDYSQPP